MLSLPIAAFLVGALLTLLLPVGLLIAVSIWYWIFSARVPETAAARVPETAAGWETSADPSAASPGLTIPQALPPDPEG
ncbi:MAG TPA: hypothetical protein VMV16_08785 [Solirubrobacteraceae bacterium]|nr:hypothetical protein [Solirubrobacteraceae bacterium]